MLKRKVSGRGCVAVAIHVARSIPSDSANPVSGALSARANKPSAPLRSPMLAPKVAPLCVLRSR